MIFLWTLSSLRIVDMSHDDLIQSRLRELVGDPEFTNANRNWVQCIVQGKVDEAVTEINQFLLTPPAFMWLGLAHAIASGKSAKQISGMRNDSKSHGQCCTGHHLWHRLTLGVVVL